MALRSEDIRVCSSGKRTASSSAAADFIAGEIEFVRNLGPVSELIVRCQQERLRCVGSDAWFREAAVGQQVDVVIDPQRCSVFAATA